MSKAYNMIEWTFLRAILCKMGYNEWWVNLILQCVNSMSYKVSQTNGDIGPVPQVEGFDKGTLYHRICSLCVPMAFQL